MDSAERDGIADADDESAAGLSVAHLGAEEAHAGFKAAATIEGSDGGAGARAAMLLEGFEEATEARGRKRTEAEVADEEDFLDEAGGRFGAETGERAAGAEAGGVVVGTEVRGTGDGHVDGDQGNTGLVEEAGEFGAGVGLRLEDDRAIDVLANHALGIAEGVDAAAAVIEREEFDAMLGSALPDRVGDGAGEGEPVVARGEADSLDAVVNEPERGAEAAGGGLNGPAFVFEGAQNAQHGGLIEAGLAGELGERD